MNSADCCLIKNSKLNNKLGIFKRMNDCFERILFLRNTTKSVKN
jgi:hypothetical protein